MKIKNNSIIINKRVANTHNSTLGILSVDGIPIGFVVEDEPREVKVMAETRIPAGTYRLRLRKLLTGLTKKYRSKYPWFKYHIELQGVPGFTGIYIHIGNTEAHTAGCQVIGLDASTRNGEYINKRSKDLFKEFYLAVYTILNDGGELTYQIID